MKYILAFIGAVALACPARGEYTYEYTPFLVDAKEWWYQGEYADSEGVTNPFACGFVLEERPSAEEGVRVMACNVVNERYENVFGRPIAMLYEDVEAHRVSVMPMIKEAFDEYGPVDMYGNPQVRFVAAGCSFGYHAEGLPPAEEGAMSYNPEVYPCTIYEFNLPTYYTGPDGVEVVLKDWTYTDTGTEVLMVFGYAADDYSSILPDYLEGIGCEFSQLGVFLNPCHQPVDWELYNIINPELTAVREKEGLVLYEKTE